MIKHASPLIRALFFFGALKMRDFLENFVDNHPKSSQVVVECLTVFVIMIVLAAVIHGSR